MKINLLSEIKYDVEFFKKGSIQKYSKIWDPTPLKLVQMRRKLPFLMGCDKAIENQ